MAGLGMTPEFWADKTVFLTGHTGFKGAWAGRILSNFGANVHGFSLAPETDPSLTELLGDKCLASSTIADIRDGQAVDKAVQDAHPDIVLHMAAQPLVRRSYREPVSTFETNVIGTINLLEAVRKTESTRAVLVVTSDKVYENDEGGRAFTENDRLGGHDPYAASKAACEIAVKSWRLSYFDAMDCVLHSARGGNVIGGGDFSEDRLIPDIVRAELADDPLVLRSPKATRPWQHVMDCLDGYFCFLEQAYASKTLPDALNFGPHDPNDVLTVEAVQKLFTQAIGSEGNWHLSDQQEPHEMAALSINSSTAFDTLGWRGRLSSQAAVEWTARWYAAWRNGADVTSLTDQQIDDYLKTQRS